MVNALRTGGAREVVERFSEAGGCAGAVVRMGMCLPVRIVCVFVYM